MPYAVASLADLPVSLQPAAGQSFNSTDRPVSFCVFPGRTYLKEWGRWENTPEQALLFTEAGILSIQAPASPGQSARMISMRAADLLYARISLILMYGRMELVGKDLTWVVVEFNAAGFDLIQDGLQNFLGVSAGNNLNSFPQAAPPKTLLDALGGLSYKFRNGLVLYGLLPGEQILGFVFQPALWGRRWHLLPLKISETTLLVLTDKQLIIVEEQSRSRFPAYGWTFTFYPRPIIENVGVKSASPWPEVIIELKRGAGLHDRSLLLEEPNSLAWQALWSCFGNLLPVP